MRHLACRVSRIHSQSPPSPLAEADGSRGLRYPRLWKGHGLFRGCISEARAAHKRSHCHCQEAQSRQHPQKHQDRGHHDRHDQPEEEGEPLNQGSPFCSRFSLIGRPSRRYSSTGSWESRLCRPNRRGLARGHRNRRHARTCPGLYVFHYGSHPCPASTRISC